MGLQRSSKSHSPPLPFTETLVLRYGKEIGVAANGFRPHGAGRKIALRSSLLAALGFFWMKVKHPAAYACLELGAAAGVAFDASLETAISQKTGHGVLAILGAL